MTSRSLIALAKKGEPIQYGSWGIGSTGQFCAEILMQQTGIKMEHVPFNGIAKLAGDLLGGHISLATLDMATATPLVKDGSIKALAACGERSPSLPDVATYKEQGVPFDRSLSWAMYAPAGLAPPIAQKLSAALKDALGDAEVKEKLLGLGITPQFVPGDEQRDINAARHRGLEAGCQGCRHRGQVSKCQERSDRSAGMSRIFGAVRQNGYVVRDIQAAMKHWIEVMGVGPWYYMDRVKTDWFRHRGQDFAVEMSIALANSGDLQIELIQQRNDAPSLYKEFLDAGHEGLQHMSYWSHDYQALYDKALGLGYRIGHEGQIGGDKGRFAYFDTQAHPGTMIEISDISGTKGPFFEKVRQAAMNWDGTRPIREVGGAKS